MNQTQVGMVAVSRAELFNGKTKGSLERNVVNVPGSFGLISLREFAVGNGDVDRFIEISSESPLGVWLV